MEITLVLAIGMVLGTALGVSAVHGKSETRKTTRKTEITQSKSDFADEKINSIISAKNAG